MSSSDSQASSDTSYSNSTKVLGQGAQYADNGAAIVNDTAYNANTNTNTAFLDSSTSSTNLTDSGNTTTNYNSTTLDGGSIDMAGRTALAALNLGGYAIDANTSTLKTGFDFGTKTLNSSIGSIADTVKGAFNFSNAAADRATAAAADAQAGAFGFAAQSAANAAATQSDAFGFAAQSAAQTAAAQRQAADYIYGNTQDALAYGKYETGAALDSLNTSAGMVATAYADAKGRGALTDKIMMLAIAGAALVAFAAVRR